MEACICIMQARAIRSEANAKVYGETQNLRVLDCVSLIRMQKKERECYEPPCTQSKIKYGSLYTNKLREIGLD